MPNLFKTTRRLAFAVILLAVGHTTASHTVAGDESLSQIESIQVGFDGHYKVGRWTPLKVRYHSQQAGSVRLVVQVTDPNGSLTAVTGDPVVLPTDGTYTLQTSFRPGRINDTLIVRIVAASEAADGATPRVLADRRWRANAAGPFKPAHRQSVQLIATLGHPAGFRSMRSKSTTETEMDQKPRRHSAQQNRQSDGIFVAELDKADELPRNVVDYDALDVVVVAGEYALDEARSGALRDWVRNGGHLVISVNRESRSFRESRLATWLPFAVGKEPLQLADTSLSGLESFAETDQRLVVRTRVDAAQLTVSEGAIPVEALGTPLLARTPVGFGLVTVLGMDLNRPPLETWSAIDAFCERLVSDRQMERQRTSTQSKSGRLTHDGITELATQLNAIQEDFPDVDRFSSWMVMVLILVYMILIGPLDYLLVHHVLRRPHVTWATFPTMVLLATVLTIWVANRTNGHDIQMNQLDIVDFDAATGWTRSHHWSTVYSPEHRRYHVRIVPENPVWPASVPTSGDVATADSNHVMPVVSWSGIPENVYGGMYRNAGFEIGRARYAYSPHATEILDLPIPVWSTRGLAATWSYQANPIADSTLRSTGGAKLSGTFTHRLPVPITDWVVAHGNTVYIPAVRKLKRHDALAPGQPWNPADSSVVYSRELRGYLTGKTRSRVERGSGVGADILIEQLRYDPLLRDPDSLVKILTFHEAAGGEGYTGLRNSALRTLDCSSMLHLDRAVLLGRVELPAARVTLDGEAVTPGHHDTFIRILLPVENRHVEYQELPEFDNTKTN